jgi:hypothetical protein
MTAPKFHHISLTVLLACAASAQERPLRFEGEVKLGQEFRREIGHGLVFVLKPAPAGNPQGWTIMISPVKPSGQPGCDDFVWVATPPYRGSNPRHLDTSYGTSAREAVAMSPREFQFVLTDTDCRTESQRIERLLWPYNYPDKEVKDAQEKLGASPQAQGRLTVLDSKTSSGGYVVEGKDLGTVDWLKFAVEIRFPRPAAR